MLRDYGLQLARLRTKGNELQSNDVGVVASSAASELAARRDPPFFVEDTGIFVDSLGGFPGAYAAFVYKTIGLKGVLKLLSGHSDRSAEFVSAVAFVGRSRRPRVFLGRLRGTISPTLRGRHGFGYDPIFIPDGSKRTMAELTLLEKCEVSHRAMALRAMGGWLVSTKSRESL